MALAVSALRESLARSALIQACRSATSGALWVWRTASRSAALLPLMARSISNRATIRRTASSARGATMTGVLRCFCEAMSV